MKNSEIRKLTTEEINKKIDESKEELFNLRMKQATGSLENTGRIKELRKALGLTLEKFGATLGVQKSAVSKWERGENSVPEQMFKSICREFNVSEDWLRTGEGEMYVPRTRNQEIVAFANQVMVEEDESFRKRFVTALSKASPEFWKELEKVLDETLKKD